MNYSDKKIDCRNINKKNLKDKEIQYFLKEYFDDFIDDADSKLKEMQPLWEKASLYYEGHQQPVGTYTDLVARFQSKNLSGTDQLKKDSETNIIWYPDNIIKQAVDSIIGEYTDVKKSISVSSGGINKAKNIAKKYQSIIEYHNTHIAGIDEDDEEDIWVDYRIPAIENMILFGLSWTKINFNPNRKLKLGGAIEMETIEPIEVLVDPKSKKKYFKDMMIVAKRVAIPIEDARELVAKYGIDPKELGSDSDSLTYQSLLNRGINEINSKQEYVTFYHIEYRKFYSDKTKLSDVHQLDVPDSFKKTEPSITQDTYTFFNCLYHKQLGTLSHDLNTYKQFSLTPYYNQQSRLRLFPKMHSEYFWVLQDVNNIGKTLLMDDARQQNIIRLFIGEQLANEYGDDVLRRFMRIGGTLTVKSVEDIRKQMYEYKSEGLKPEVYKLFELAKQDLKEISQRTNPLDGEFPKNRLASRTVNTLISQSRKSLNYIDINITYAAIKESQLMYKIIRDEMTEEQIMVMTSESKSDAKRIPVNAKMDLLKYQQLIQANETTLEEFESENDVRYIYPVIPGKNELPIKKPEELALKTVVAVNPLMHSDNVSINVVLDFEAEREKYDKAQALTYLFDKQEVGMAVFPQLLEALGLENDSREIMEKVEDRNKMKPIEDAILQRPGSEQIVLQALQQYDMIKSKANQQNINQ